MEVWRRPWMLTAPPSPFLLFAKTSSSSSSASLLSDAFQLPSSHHRTRSAVEAAGQTNFHPALPYFLSFSSVPPPSSWSLYPPYFGPPCSPAALPYTASVWAVSSASSFWSAVVSSCCPVRIPLSLPLAPYSRTRTILPVLDFSTVLFSCFLLKK